MSKIYEKYLQLKKENNDKMYLFKSGKFYIFIGDDAKDISEKVVLKLTPFTKDVMKCGFPLSSLQDYLRVFANLGLNVEVIEKKEMSLEEKQNKVWKILQKLDLEKLTPLNAFEELLKIKEIMNE